ncbi:acyltransferase [Paenibacillus sp. V4I7]|uniref:acyltransferase family protein n=1 Tax=Paenibacillus sp. V4I7 TaxID=3042307 RepID=UPI00278AB3E8|nr:acyltransferase [Paenibacillus sp. V4I7]MDQ0903973.1 exopolysaccharide production protein ExoZ [Paenibacillus sp. V4I7]
MYDHLIKGKFDSLQLLRGIAACVVVIFHEFGTYGLFKYGKYGVDLFFVLSGFIILYTHHTKIGEKKVLVPFILKRIIRVFPIYWFMTFVYILLVSVSGFGSTLSIDYVLKSLFLLPQDKLPVIGVAWTLEFEMLFYFIFGLLMFNRKILYTTLTLWGLTIIYFFIFPTALPKAIEHIVSPLNLEFLFGCGIAVVVIKRKISAEWMTRLGIISIVTSLTLQYFNILKINDAIAWGIPFSILILGLVSLEMKKRLNIPKTLIYLGNASYSIYLSHLITLLVLESILEKLGLHKQYGHNGFVQLTFSVVAIFLGCVFYSLVEKPLLKYVRSWFTNKKKVVDIEININNSNSKKIGQSHI